MIHTIKFIIETDHYYKIIHLINPIKFWRYLN